ncbi:T9SS type A sorting domain-containing protein [bacterium]|nr:T9SS type A sorting domain-containing protein [bacterium]
MKTRLRFLPLILLALPDFAQAQSISVLSFDTLVQGNASNATDIFAHAAIQNVGNAAIDIRVKRRILDNNALTDENAICWVVCYDNATDVSLFTINLAPGATSTNDFTGHVYPDADGTEYNGQIAYTFFDDANPNDSATIVVRFETVRGLSLTDAGKNSWKVYPNPADQFVEFSLDPVHYKGAQVVITDLLGHTVRSKTFGVGESKLRLNIGDLKGGVYMYTLVVGGKAVETRKLVVRHR